MGTVTVTLATKKRNFSLHGESTDNDGDKWKISFTIIYLKHRHTVLVRAKCISRRAPMMTAPRDANKILELWPIQFWPDFARPLASASGNHNGNSIQEGLFQ